MASLVPSSVRPTPWSVPRATAFERAGYPLADGGLIVVDPEPHDRVGVRVVGSPAEGLRAFREGALDTLVWPDEEAVL